MKISDKTPPKRSKNKTIDKLLPKPIPTKERILEASRILFNAHGTETVSTRQIAGALGMSQGNLTYHFSTKEEIISALYGQLVEKMNLQVEGLSPNAASNLTLRQILDSATITFAIFYEYKFFMLDFVSIMRTIPTIHQHYQELSRLRKEQFSAIRVIMVKRGWLKAEVIENFDAEMNELMQIVGDFWISHAEIHYKGKEKEKIAHYAQVFSMLFIPHLTKKGLKELQQ